MARAFTQRDASAVLAAAERWISECLIEDGSVFSPNHRWTATLIDEVYHAFVEHPDEGTDDFMTKLKGQMATASAPAQQLMAELIWALLLFPSNMRPQTKRQQVREIWAWSGEQLSSDHSLLADQVLQGIGSGGQAFNTLRYLELAFLIEVLRDLKQKDASRRRQVLTHYDAFVEWIASVPQKGHRQYRHMLRYFTFPDRVERMSSNNDRMKILVEFDVAASRDVKQWNDQQLDDGLGELRAKLEREFPSRPLDFYEPPLRERWSRDHKVKTVAGEVSVTIPSDDDDDEEAEATQEQAAAPEARRSFQIQAQLVEIGAKMGFRIWVPRSDFGRVKDLVAEQDHGAFLDELPLNADSVTMSTIEQIDVLWLRGRSIVRAFEVEHTTAVYSGLLRMADLIALQPNMHVHLHIVAPDERRDKVFREMKRPVFSYLEAGPLAKTCTFISYESVEALHDLEYLAHTNESIIEEYEEPAEPTS